MRHWRLNVPVRIGPSALFCINTCCDILNRRCGAMGTFTLAAVATDVCNSLSNAYWSWHK